jgi:hypothetical protein
MGDRYFMSNLEGLMKKRSVKTSKKQTTAIEQMYNATLPYSNTMNNLCDRIILAYDELLWFTKVHKNKRAMHVLDYMSSRMHIIRSLKKRLCKLYTITDHKDFTDEFDNIYSRYYKELSSFKQVLEYIEYIFNNNAVKEYIIAFNISPMPSSNNISDTQYDKSKYHLRLYLKGEAK